MLRCHSAIDTPLRLASRGALARSKSGRLAHATRPIEEGSDWTAADLEKSLSQDIQDGEVKPETIRRFGVFSKALAMPVAGSKLLLDVQAFSESPSLLVV